MSSYNDDSGYVVKVEMKNLALTEELKRDIQDTLKFLHGEDFVHKEQSAYKDKKIKLDKQYWRDRGNLIVKGGQSNLESNSKLGLPQEKINQFAIGKLERYGFHPNHCREALRITNGDVGSAYELLMCRYFSVDLPEPAPIPKNLIEERSQELDSLRSIYDNCCEERITNQLWVFHLDLPYLSEIYLDKKQSRANQYRRNKRDREVCRYFKRGICKFGTNCRFSHELNTANEKPPTISVDENRNKFCLEVRFPYGSRYPLEPPLVSLTSKWENFPTKTCLQITNRLMIEVKKSVKLEQPCVFILMDLICNRQEEVLNVLQQKQESFYDPSMMLLPQSTSKENLNEDNVNDKNNCNPESNNVTKTTNNANHIARIDNELRKKHKNLVEDPKFRQVITKRKELPAWSKQDEILELIKENQVSFIGGETGCGKSTQHGTLVCKTMLLWDPEGINYELIEILLEYIVTGDHDFPREGSILVFLPGIGEIREMLSRLETNPLFCPKNQEFVIIALHSSLSNEEQSLVFRRTRRGERKIVLATNIAETSITIDDCVFVIDSGKMKEKGFDSNKNMESLNLVEVSKANTLQRKGRAGRVMPGVCFHLYSSQRYEYILKAQPEPEIQRVPLEQLVLRIKTLPCFENKELFSVMSGIIEAPSKDSVEAAITTLYNVGALDENTVLTPLGKHLSSLPVDVRIGKLILYGAIFCAVDSAFTIAAFLSYKSPFTVPLGKKDDCNVKRKKFTTSNSDHLTTLNAYKAWLKIMEKGRTKAAAIFAKENYLSFRTLTSIGDMKLQFLELLLDIGFIPGNIEVPKRKSGGDRVLELTGPELNANGDNQKLLSAIICASLYPNIVKVLTPEKYYKQSISGAIPQNLKPEDLVLKTKSDGYVYIHPTSVNHSVSTYPSPYLVFQEKIKTSKVFIRDCTMVPVLPLVLFSSGTLNVELVSGEFMISLDNGWIMFPVPSNEIAELLESIKTELLLLLDQKIKEPKMNLLKHPKGKKIISTIIKLVSAQ